MDPSWTEAGKFVEGEGRQGKSRVTVAQLVSSVSDFMNFKVWLSIQVALRQKVNALSCELRKKMFQEGRKATLQQTEKDSGALAFHCQVQLQGH